MQIEIANRLICRGVPPALKQTIKARLTFPNPRWIENERLGYWNGETPREIRSYREMEGALILPRGFGRQLISLCHGKDIKPKITDRRRELPPVDFEFRGTLRPFQQEAVKDLLSRDFGTLSAPTGCGKTVIALYALAARRQPALIVSHTKELQGQWVSRIGTFLGIPSEDIGIIGNGRCTMGKKITVALVQSLYKCADEVAPSVGHLVVDECHRAPSRTFTEAVTAFDSKYMLGLSATPWRRDGLSRFIFWYLGDVVHEVEKASLVEQGDVLRAEVVFRETKFQTSFDPSEEYSRVLSELTQDPGRNVLIAKDVIREANNGGGICLVLSDRKAHCLELQKLIESLPGRLPAELLTGALSSKERQAVVERLDSGKVKVLIATGALLGEGFDCKELSTLFLGTPIRFDGRLLQYLGRVLRPALVKREARVFDYVDARVPVLRASAKSRARVYKRECPE